MLSRHPMAEETHHDRTLAELVHERNIMANNPAMNLAESHEEGHMFDHEPGMPDYHRHTRSPEYDHHEERYAEAGFPVYKQLEH